MRTLTSSVRQNDGRLWVIALLLSLLVNVGLLGVLGFTMMKSEILRRPRPTLPTPPPTSDTTVTIFPEAAAADSAGITIAAAQSRLARTSEDQTAPRPEKSSFIGERNTQATSDRRPDLTAPALPSQAGADRDDLETTVSNYQDGKLGSDPPPIPQEAAPPPPPQEMSTTETLTSDRQVKTPGADISQASAAPQETLLNGPSPVDVPVPRSRETSTEVKPTPPKRFADSPAVPQTQVSPKAAASKPATAPGFKGHQRKAAIVGSISRTGRSALDVVDSPLGRYQAVVSRAVELEWQRNCVRHRDFITPGFLTVRFYVEPGGKVRTVQFVGEMETGEVQKGFTLSAIRDADIPAMPPAVKKDFQKEPLELIFNFYF